MHKEIIKTLCNLPGKCYICYNEVSQRGNIGTLKISYQSRYLVLTRSADSNKCSVCEQVFDIRTSVLCVGFSASVSSTRPQKHYKPYQDTSERRRESERCMNDRFMNLTLVTTNKELEKRMNTIQKEINGLQRSANVIGKALFEIRNQELWKDDYNSFEECAGVFEIKKSQAYKLIKGYEVGEKKLLLGTKGEAVKMSTEYTNTQCVEIARLGDEGKMVEFIRAEKIKPSMSVKEIRDVVDREKYPEKFIETEETTEATETTETTEATNEGFTTATVLRADFVEGEIKLVTDLQLTEADATKIAAILKKYVK